MTTLILIRGASGSGKSTLLEALRPELARCALIDLDTVWGMLGAAQWGTSTWERHIALRQTARLVEGYAAHGLRAVIVAADFLHGDLRTFRSMTPTAPAAVINLLVDEEEHRRRLNQRPTDADHDVPRALHTNQAIGRDGLADDDIDTTALDAATVAQRVRAILQRVVMP